jgi:hypothetical protein
MPLRLTIAGQLNAGAFHKAKAVAESAGCALDLSVVSLQPADYEEWKAALRRELGGLAWRHKAPVACYTEDEFIGDDTALLAWLRKQRVAFSASALNSDGKAAGWDELADAAYLAHLSSTGFSYAFLDLQLDGEPFGRLVFELYKHLLPKTVANFEALCAGGLPSDGARPRPLEPSLCSSPPALLCSTPSRPRLRRQALPGLARAPHRGRRLAAGDQPLHTQHPSAMHRCDRREPRNGWSQGGDIVGGTGANSVAAAGGVLPDESFAVPTIASHRIACTG